MVVVAATRVRAGEARSAILRARARLADRPQRRARERGVETGVGPARFIVTTRSTERQRRDAKPLVAPRLRRAVPRVMARRPDRPRHRARIDLQRLVAHQRLGAAELMLGLLAVLPLTARVALGALLGRHSPGSSNKLHRCPAGTLHTVRGAFLPRPGRPDTRRPTARSQPCIRSRTANLCRAARAARIARTDGLRASVPS